jgi:hypothetical protein
MPGAPNKPPDVAPPPAPATAAAPDRVHHALRRLAPARVVLRLPLWRGAPHPDLVNPLERAATLLAKEEFVEVEKALDQFAVRLAEPRWPTIPEPWSRLRVEIPVPQPPHWNPDSKLTPAERETKKARQWAETQLRLAQAAIELAPTLGLDPADTRSGVLEAETLLDRDGPSAGFWAPLDRLWETIRDRVPLPTPAPRSTATAKLPPGIAPDDEA